MFAQLFVKIQNVAVRVALAENRDEPEDVSLESVALAISVDEPSHASFGRRVKRSLDRERRVLRRGDFFRLAINAAGGAERDALDAVGAHRLQHVESGDGILLKILARMLQAEPHVGVGGEVKNKIAPGHRLGERGQIQAIASDQLELGIFERAFEKFILAGGKIIVSRRPICRPATTGQPGCCR